MRAVFRLTEILEIARGEGRVTVEDLAVRLGVTAQTIRRDLAELDAEGQIERVHGGAVLRSGTVNIAYRQRRALQATEKRAIARAYARSLPEGASVFLAIGTTVEAVAEELSRRADLMAVTNNLNVANMLQAGAEAQVIVTGGRVRRADGGLTGTLAAAAARQFRVDVAIIGCSALDPSGDLMDFDLDEVGVSRALIEQARKTWVVADHSKLARTAPARIASLSEVDTLFTDKPLPERLAAQCAEWGTRVCVVDPE
jgi:DeoR family transcriptional regulator, glycerol-3-phosphate regulon repressor